MHAVLVRVNIDDSEAATARLRDEVVPRVSQAQGFVAGHWTRKGNTGPANVRAVCALADASVRVTFLSARAQATFHRGGGECESPTAGLWADV
jgi:hypothetical protein